jgi:CDP-2,3-bis-(O-geranylgeranyl)-sn-glycerol synthase
MFIIQSLWYFLPAGIANMMPVFMKKSFKALDIPLDMGKKFRGKPILGRNKTVRGLIFGVIGAIAVVLIQTVLYNNYSFFQDISIVPYNQQNIILLGFLMGFGALLGDLVKSFIKRQIEVDPGKRFIPFDQVDFVIGFLLVSSIVFVPPWQVALFLIVIIPLFHIVINHIGYYTGIQKVKW